LEDLEAAMTSLDDYERKETKRHPLYLLALARLNQLEKKRFLSEFLEKYPDASNRWLNRDEILMLKGE
jgi:hypothetical protein